jgi:hypothetical protein
MTAADKIKLVLTAWGIPLLIVGVAVLSTPDPHQRIGDFPAVELKPASITAVRKVGTRRTDYFELWIRDEDGRGFFHRDPEPGPIEDLKSRIPEGASLRLVYRATRAGNVLLEIAASRPPHEQFLAFDSVMGAYRRRRFVVYAVAAAWFIAFTFLMVFKLRWHAGQGVPAATTQAL